MCGLRHTSAIFSKKFREGKALIPRGSRHRTRRCRVSHQLVSSQLRLPNGTHNHGLASDPTSLLPSSPHQGLNF